MLFRLGEQMLGVLPAVFELAEVGFGLARQLLGSVNLGAGRLDGVFVMVELLRDLPLLAEQPFQFLFARDEFRLGVGELLQTAVMLRRRGFELAVGARQRVRDVLQGGLLLGDLAVEIVQFLLEPAQFAFAGDESCFAAGHADEQRTVRLQRFALQRDESAAAADGGGQPNRGFHRLHDPGIGEDRRGQSIDAAFGLHQLIGAADDAGMAGQIGEVVSGWEKVNESGLLQELRRGRLLGAIRNRQKSDAAAKLAQTLFEVVQQRLVFRQHDQFGPRTQGDFQQRRMFEVDIQQIGDAADHRVPRRMLGRLRPAEDLLGADAEAFLPQFEVFQQAFAGGGRAAAFAIFGQSRFRRILHAEQRLSARVNLPQ